MKFDVLIPDNVPSTVGVSAFTYHMSPPKTVVVAGEWIEIQGGVLIIKDKSGNATAAFHQWINVTPHKECPCSNG